MNDDEKRKCSCPYCPGHAEIQRYGGLELTLCATEQAQITFEEYIASLPAHGSTPPDREHTK